MGKSKHSPADSEVRNELSKFLAPEYVNLAFNLPPHSTTTFWQMTKNDIEAYGAEDRYCDYAMLLEFLSKFFSVDLVRETGARLQFLTDSSLGFGYAWRKGKDDYGCKVIDGIVEGQNIEDGPLKGFLGVALGDDEQQHIRPGGGGSDPPREGGGGQVRGAGNSSWGGSRGRGRGRGRQGGRLPGGEAIVANEYFQSVIIVNLPGFKTARKQAVERRLTIGERSSLFVNHDNVRNHRSSLPFNPHTQLEGATVLYHGTRRSCWTSSFRTKGINPPLTRNEFCGGAAFYVANCPRFAFEQPLHNHPGRALDDYIAVLEFRLDVQVLYGERVLPGSGQMLKVLWFDEAGRDWQDFCKGNLEGTLRMQHWDIVIGPCCKPTRDRSLNAINLELEGGAPLTQVAFCSSRSMLWLETCLQRVYYEERNF